MKVGRSELIALFTINQERRNYLGPLVIRTISIDCSELSADEKLALASSISEGLQGMALALIRGESIVLDPLSTQKPDIKRVEALVANFISRRKDSESYSVEVNGEEIVVYSADPIAAMRRKRENELPPNVSQCPFCGFITLYEEKYRAHVLLHYLRL